MKDVTIVSLSSGIIGESFVKFEVEIGVKRLEEAGLRVHFSENAQKGLAYIKEHPECRAKDLIEAFESDTDMILCAIGGDDTYRLLPYLFDHGELQKSVKDKIFLGFSDTTINHLMLHKVGMRTFYGQAFLPDLCELDKEMLPYTKFYFDELITTGTIAKITPSEVWYEERTDFSPSAVGIPRNSHENDGFKLLQGEACFEGEILGGCIDTIYDIFNNERYADSVAMCEKYQLFPTLEDWRGKILLLETSEEKPTPDRYRKMIRELKQVGVFNVVNGVLIGKPQDETYFEEYQEILKEEIANPNLSIVVNLNVGHATPRCIIPFGVHAKVDVTKQEIVFG